MCEILTGPSNVAECDRFGMPAEVLIKKRARTALDYLLQPVADAMGRAWHED